MLLHHIRDFTDPLTRVIKDDPVRPHIPLTQRITPTAEILCLREGDDVLAVTCLQWLQQIPQSEAELLTQHDSRNVAVFYTIWSYSPGAGAELIRQAAAWILQEHAAVTAIVTLSPLTDMARRFHLKNGAKVLQTNSTTVNYQYYHSAATE